MSIIHVAFVAKIFPNFIFEINNPDKLLFFLHLVVHFSQVMDVR